MSYFIYQQNGYPKRPSVSTGEPLPFIKDGMATLDMQKDAIHGLVCDFYCDDNNLSKREALALFYRLRAKALAQIDSVAPSGLGRKLILEEATCGS